MLECSRLRMLQVVSVPYEGGNSERWRKNSIASILPDVKLVTRRPSVGRASMSRHPSLEPLKEEKDSPIENAYAGESSLGPGQDLVELSVTLKRSTSNDTFGFGLAVSSDNKLYIYKISSNIYNWGMLQVGDRVTKINGVVVAASSTGGPIDCDSAATLINSSNEVTLSLARQVKQTIKTEMVSTRGSLALAVPPRLLTSRLSKLKQERAADESKLAKTQQGGIDHDAGDGHTDKLDTKQNSSDLSFAQSIANIISTAGL